MRLTSWRCDKCGSKLFLTGFGNVFCKACYALKGKEKEWAEKQHRAWIQEFRKERLAR